MKNDLPLKILLADDHEFYLEGLKGFFSNQQLYEIVGQAYNGKELVQLHEQLLPHIVLTDLRMPVMDGATAIREMLKLNPDLRCIVLTSYDTEHFIVDAMEAGALGYITKHMPRVELFEALDQVSRGFPYFCSSTSLKLTRLLGKSPFDPFKKKQQAVFTPIEKKIIQLICEDRSNVEIAALLCMSIRTIENNRSRIFRKMNVKTTAGVAVYAIKHLIYFLEEDRL